MGVRGGGGGECFVCSGIDKWEETRFDIICLKRSTNR